MAHRVSGERPDGEVSAPTLPTDHAPAFDRGDLIHTDPQTAGPAETLLIQLGVLDESTTDFAITSSSSVFHGPIVFPIDIFRNF